MTYLEEAGQQKTLRKLPLCLHCVLVLVRLDEVRGSFALVSLPLISAQLWASAARSPVFSPPCRLKAATPAGRWATC